ncbi:hypothetical protein OCU04_011745 [Sclerotinia nivalis]|uniref:Uncharacterized protein n=1 Tax=Sclerotinia nivalis TaxID=352851 RepID=A0A9X0DCV4_9HELO|nr:hypothetical protein OCU04_011745 [Sclerotinia nivalis]
MRRRVQYESEDSLLEDESSSIDSFDESDLEKEHHSESESEQEECQISRIRPRGRSSSRPSCHWGDCSSDSGYEEDLEEVRRHSLRSSSMCCEPRFTPSTFVQHDSFAPNFIPIPMVLVPSSYSDTAYYFANSGRNHQYDHNNTMMWPPHLRMDDRGEDWRIRETAANQYGRQNIYIQEMERQENLRRERFGRDYYEGRRERGRYRRNSSSGSERDFRVQDYDEEGRSSGGIRRWFASTLLSSISGG